MFIIHFIILQFGLLYFEKYFAMQILLQMKLTDCFKTRLFFGSIFVKIIILRSETVNFHYLAALLISCQGGKLIKIYRGLLLVCTNARE